MITCSLSEDVQKHGIGRYLIECADAESFFLGYDIRRSVGGAGRRLPEDTGYYRAIAGMRAASSGAFERASARMPSAVQRLLRGAELGKLIDVPRVSFESMMRKRVRAAMAMFSGRI